MPALTDAVTRTRPVTVLDDEPESFTISTPAMTAKPAEPKEPIFNAFARSLVTSDELRTLELPKRKNLLGGFFCEDDFGFVYAARGVGKTWLGQAIAHAVASQSPLGPWQAGDDPTPVLYIDCEMPADLSRDRDRAVADAVVPKGKGGDLMYLHHDLLFERTGKTMNFGDVECQQALTRVLIDNGRKLMILDNLSTGIRGVRENEGFDWENIQNWLLDLRHRHIAVLMLAHAGRNGEMRGTSKREDPASWIIKLTDAKESAGSGASFVSHFAKPSRNAPHGVPDVQWTFTTRPDDSLVISHKKAESVDRFRSLIEEGVTSCGDLSELLGVTAGAVSKRAAKGERDGWLVKNGRTYKVKA